MAADPARELARAIQQYEDVPPLLAAHVISDAKMEALDSALDRWRPGNTTQPGYPALGGQIASAGSTANPPAISQAGGVAAERWGVSGR